MLSGFINYTMIPCAMKRQDGVERYEVISARPHIGVLLMAAAVVGGQAIASVAPEKCNLVIIWHGWYIQLLKRKQVQ